MIRLAIYYLEVYDYYMIDNTIPDSELPVVSCWESGNDMVETYDCPYCGELHEHGLKDFNEFDGKSHSSRRLAHCGKGEYMLKRVKPELLS
jgi:hypothetical protein